MRGLGRYDKSIENYCVLEPYPENLDGTMKDPYLMFMPMPLEVAMKNAHCDAPRF